MLSILDLPSRLKWNTNTSTSPRTSSSTDVFEMIYNKCSLAELEKFITDRGLEPPTQATRASKRFYYIAFLEAQDAESSFRFLDLYPELRNRIYTELLVERGSSRRYPQILATCQQIRNEASGILYAENKFEITMQSDQVYVQGKKKPKLPYLPPEDEWPDFLLRAQHLSFCFKSVDWGLSRDAKRILFTSQFMFGLCDYLGQRHHLRTFKIDVSCPEYRGYAGTTHRGSSHNPRRPTNVDLFCLRMIQKPNLHISIHGTEIPQSIVKSREEARRLLIDAIRSLCRQLPVFRSIYDPLIVARFGPFSTWRSQRLESAAARLRERSDEELVNDGRELHEFAALAKVIFYEYPDIQPLKALQVFHVQILSVIRAWVEDRAMSKDEV